MKKILVVMSIAFAALTTNASYLYWQCSGTEDGLSGLVGNKTISSIYLVEKDTSGNTTALASVIPDGTSTGKSTTLTGYTTSSEGGIYSALGSSATTGYSYYIEVSCYTQGSSGDTSVVAQSSEISYASLAGNDYYTTDLPQTMQAVATAWSGTSYNAPEPTSGLLLLVGGALLALRRKRA